MIRRGVFAITVLSALAGAAAASPESEKLFREGRDLLKAGQIPEACEAFARSEQLVPKVGTLLNLADCREKQGQTATAWALFNEAHDLATTTGDNRKSEADKRANAIKAKLAYITLAVAPERRVPGLVIKRNGVAVDPTQWSVPVALDPGDYAFEAAAPGFKPWSTRQTLAVKATITVDMVALEPERPPVQLRVEDQPGAPISTSSTEPGRPEHTNIHDTTTPLGPGPEPDLHVRSLGIGLVTGVTSEHDIVGGFRISGGLAVPHGALRAIGSVLYTPLDNTTDLFAIGLSADYVWMPIPLIGVAGGFGLGLDRHESSADWPGSSTLTWWTLRASPLIVRLANGHVEAGFHVQYVRVDGSSAELGLVAIDLFPL